MAMHRFVQTAGGDVAAAGHEIGQHLRGRDVEQGDFEILVGVECADQLVEAAPGALEGTQRGAAQHATQAVGHRVIDPLAVHGLARIGIGEDVRRDRFGDELVGDAGGAWRGLRRGRGRTAQKSLDGVGIFLVVGGGFRHLGRRRGGGDAPQAARGGLEARRVVELTAQRGERLHQRQMRCERIRGEILERGELQTQGRLGSESSRQHDTRRDARHAGIESVQIDAARSARGETR